MVSGKPSMPPSFIIYPIIIDKVCLGLFYADKENEGPPIPENQLIFYEDLTKPVYYRHKAEPIIRGTCLN